MLSFDVSAIDVVLLVAVMVLFILLVTQRKSQSVTKPQLSTDVQEKVPKKTGKGEKAKAEDSVKKKSVDGFQECVHEFGHLKNMPKNTPIPDECFGCPKVLRCMFPDPEQEIQATG